MKRDLDPRESTWALALVAVVVGLVGTVLGWVLWMIFVDQPAPPSPRPVTPSVATGDADPRVLVLPWGRFEASEICLVFDDRPVRAEVHADGRVTVRRGDGLNVPDANVRLLVPCLRALHGPESVMAPGALLEQFDGSSVLLTDTISLALVAVVEPPGASRETRCWVWFVARDGVVHTGLVALAAVTGDIPQHA